jgi:hypothetical protein
MVANSTHKLWNNECCLIIIVWLWYLNVIANKKILNSHKNLTMQLVKSSLGQVLFSIFITLILQLLFDDFWNQHT